MKIHNIPTLLSASAFALMFTSCEKNDVAEAEADKMEAQADYIKKTSEAEADKLDDVNENQAERVRQGGEAKADALNEKADEVRDTGTAPATGGDVE